MAYKDEVLFKVVYKIQIFFLSSPSLIIYELFTPKHNALAHLYNTYSKVMFWNNIVQNDSNKLSPFLAF